MTEDTKASPAEERASYFAILLGPVLFDPALPDFTKLLYAVITSLTDQTGFCWASNAYFARKFGKAPRTIQRSLKELQDGGFIRIIDGDGGSGRRKIYAGIGPVPADHDKNVTVTMTKMSRGHDKNVMENNKENTKEKNPPKAPQGAASVPTWKPDRFAGLWTYYPRHTSKQAAAKAWDKLKPSDELIAVIGKALRRQKAWDEWQRGIGIPHLATYLNQRRWEDELEDPHRAAEPAWSSEQEAMPWI